MACNQAKPAGRIELPQAPARAVFRWRYTNWDVSAVQLLCEVLEERLDSAVLILDELFLDGHEEFTHESH